MEWKGVADGEPGPMCERVNMVKNLTNLTGVDV